MPATDIVDLRELETVSRERAYYEALLRLARHEEPQALIEDALRLLVEIASAREGYLELSNDETGETIRWATSHGCEPERVEAIQFTISRGLIAEALATGELVLTPSARLDPRFRDLESVRDGAIEAVVCAPIGADRPLGVVYLQGMQGAEGPARVVRYVELFALSLAPVAERSMQVPRADGPATVATRDPAFAAIVGRSKAVRDVVDHLRFIGPLEVSVLLTGPTGSGKTLLARALHLAGRRMSGPFVELNCATLPEGLMENELFGADPGSHSTAPARGTPGKVEQAEGGTLFLDEVGELSLAAQAKLLQLLQSKMYYRLGGREPRHADVRLVAATNVDLAAAVTERRFREDLYFRLNVVEIRVPSLRERSEDIVPLAIHFAQRSARRHGLPSARLAPSALRAVASAEWPGNVRQLENRIESAVIRASMRGAERVELPDLAPGPEVPRVDATSLHEATREFQKRHVSAVLAETDWNVSEAARRLDVARSHLYELIRAHGLRRE